MYTNTKCNTGKRQEQLKNFAALEKLKLWGSYNYLYWKIFYCTLHTNQPVYTICIKSKHGIASEKTCTLLKEILF